MPNDTQKLYAILKAAAADLKAPYCSFGGKYADLRKAISDCNRASAKGRGR